MKIIYQAKTVVANILINVSGFLWPFVLLLLFGLCFQVFHWYVIGLDTRDVVMACVDEYFGLFIIARLLIIVAAIGRCIWLYTYVKALEKDRSYREFSENQ